MRFRFPLAVSIVAGLLLACPVWAADPAAKDEPAAKEQVKCEKGKLLLSDDFSGDALDKGWLTPKGKWEVVDGVLKGVEKPEDKHPAVIRHEFKAHDLVAQFSFRFDGGKMLAFSLNNRKGHVCRVQITPALVTVQKDKPSQTSEDKAAVIDKQKVDIKPGEWHTMEVTVCGKQLVATLDGKQIAGGSNDGIDVDKTSLGFPTTGEGASIKQVRVWEAVAH